MNFNPAIQVIYSIAAHEAISANYEFVEPEHFLNALLKYAELDDESMQVLSKNGIPEKILIGQRDQLVSELLAYGIEAPEKTSFCRRSLRNEMGMGKAAENRDKGIHRSDASRVIFTIAGTPAFLVKGEIALAGLLRAIFEKQTPAIKKVFPGLIRRNEAPVISQTGSRQQTVIPEAPPSREMTGEIKLRESVVLKDAVLLVLAKELQSPDGKHIILIQNGKRSADQVMDAVSSAIGSGAGPKSKGPRVVRIGQSFLTASKEKPAEAMNEFFQTMIQSQGRHIILYIGDFDKFAAADSSTGFIKLLQAALDTGMIKCIAGTTRDRYERFIYRITELKKIFRTVYIHDEFSIPERI
ncbi:MAG: hypothetical protein LWY06_07075 [Firmicutes bacterium]|nr:hypothetical protein [Bacillota bacterium]